MQEDAKRLSSLRDKLENGLLQNEEVTINGSREFRLPHVTNLSFKDVTGK
jgi:cysteine desulfurase